MRKIISLCVLAFVVGMLAYHCLLAAGSTTRNPVTNYDGKSNFGNIGLTGQDVSGVPAYIELTYPDAGGTNYRAYLWVSPDGKLRIASSVTMATYTSFPDVTSWGVSGAMGSVVGGQS